MCGAAVVKKQRDLNQTQKLSQTDSPVIADIKTTSNQNLN